LRGAQILSIPPPSAGTRKKKRVWPASTSSWETVQRGHAVANGCYVVVPNRVGHEAPEEAGHRVLGPKFYLRSLGRDHHEGSPDEEDVIVAEVISQCRNPGTHWPFLRDRRVMPTRTSHGALSIRRAILFVCRPLASTTARMTGVLDAPVA
jgi:N-carbamoylputrescine amidase